MGSQVGAKGAKLHCKGEGILVVSRGGEEEEENQIYAFQCACSLIQK